MAISKKPSKKSKQDVDAVISKGGSVPGDEIGESTSIKAFPLRLRQDLVVIIDGIVKASPIIPSRNAWIANAVYEQLKKEGKIE